MTVFRLFCHLAVGLGAVAATSTLPPTQLPPPQYDPVPDNGDLGPYPVRVYATAEGVTSPITNWLHWSPQCDDGLHYFFTPRGWVIDTPSPMILDARGDLVWARHFDNEFGGQAYDFAVQSYKGEDYLTFWLGDDRVRGHGAGSYYMLNSSYDIVHQVTGANGHYADLHEFLITSDGTALLTMYETTPHDVSAFRSFGDEDVDPNYIWDCLFQEVDIESGDLIFQWRASEHVNLTDTFHMIGLGGTQADPFDWFHINSVQKDELGNYIISARYPHAIYYIDGRSGDIVWTLGGKGNRFKDVSSGNGLNFAWQHDARFLPLDTFPNLYNPPAQRPGLTTQLLSLFDNAAEDNHYEYGLDYARGLLLEITYPTPGGIYPSESAAEAQGVQPELRDEGDLNQQKVESYNGTRTEHYTVRVVKEYINPQKLRTSSQGSMQIIHRQGRDPKILVGYGLNAVWTEFDANGTVLCDAHYGASTSWETGDVQSYRTFKYPWIGRPETPPSVNIADDEVEVYVSWNGATDVAHWILQSSYFDTVTEQAWWDVMKMPKNGFETTIPLPESGLVNARYLRVIAVGRDGRRLDYGTSKTMIRTSVTSWFPFSDQAFAEELRDMFPVRGFLILSGLTVAAFVVFWIYRRFLQHRLGKPSIGALRWRKGVAYRLLGDA